MNRLVEIAKPNSQIGIVSRVDTESSNPESRVVVRTTKKKKKEKLNSNIPLLQLQEYELRPFDILCGRTSEALNNVGNRRFRVTIGLNLKRYIESTHRQEKTRLVASIVHLLRDEIGARFLRRTAAGYEELHEKQCKEKVGHAFRDMAGTYHPNNNSTNTATTRKAYHNKGHRVHGVQTPKKKKQVSTSPVEKVKKPISTHKVMTVNKEPVQVKRTFDLSPQIFSAVEDLDPLPRDDWNEISFEKSLLSICESVLMEPLLGL